jgi:class 3 adenylate cyclase
MQTSTNRKPTVTRFFTSISITNRILSWICIGFILVSLFPLAVPYLDNGQSYWIVRSLQSVDQIVQQAVRDNVPTKISGKDMTRWITVIGIFFISGMFARFADRSKDKAEYYKFKHNVDTWKQQMHLSDSAVVLTPLNEKLEQLKTAKKKDREELLREFIETKKKLDEMGRDLAFLAIDIADSTGMKQEEEKAVIEHDFKEYKRFVDRTLTTYGCLKTAWTPDGVMSCFTTVDAAVRAAREVINGLDEFNKTVKIMRRDFVVRCGVNSGFVYFDESMPLEEISDRVIDIAGHMQKHAKPNSVSVAKPTIEPLNDRIGFEPAGRMVDGYEVYEWMKS